MQFNDLILFLKEEFVIPNGTKVLSARIARNNKQLMVSGDNLNNISLWKFDSVKPIQVKTHISLYLLLTFFIFFTFFYKKQKKTFSQPVAPNITKSEVSSISFSASENEIIAGSSRGVINVWDIKSQKSK